VDALELRAWSCLAGAAGSLQWQAFEGVGGGFLLGFEPPCTGTARHHHLYADLGIEDLCPIRGRFSPFCADLRWDLGPSVEVLWGKNLGVSLSSPLSRFPVDATVGPLCRVPMWGDRGSK
jgi:hypothetical protein